MKALTLDWLQSRVREEDGCWVWTGYINPQGQPQYYASGIGTRLVRRDLFALVNERSPGKKFVGARLSCVLGCTHPEHLVARTRSAVFVGKPKSLAHTAAIAKARRAGSRITDDVVARFRTTGDDSELAALNVPTSYLYRIARGEARRNYSSPFSGLGV